MEETQKVLPVKEELWELRVKDEPSGKDGWYHFVLILGQVGNQETLGQPLDALCIISYETSKFIAAYQKQSKSPTVTVQTGDVELPAVFTFGIIGGLSPLIRNFAIRQGTPTYKLSTDDFRMRLAILLPQNQNGDVSVLNREQGESFATAVRMDLLQWMQNHKDDLKAVDNTVAITFHWDVTSNRDGVCMHAYFTSSLSHSCVIAVGE